METQVSQAKAGLQADWPAASRQCITRVEHIRELEGGSGISLTDPDTQVNMTTSGTYLTGNGYQACHFDIRKKET